MSEDAVIGGHPFDHVVDSRTAESVRVMAGVTNRCSRSSVGSGRISAAHTARSAHSMRGFELPGPAAPRHSTQWCGRSGLEPAAVGRLGFKGTDKPR